MERIILWVVNVNVLILIFFFMSSLMWSYPLSKLMVEETIYTRSTMRKYSSSIFVAAEVFPHFGHKKWHEGHHLLVQFVGNVAVKI